MVRDVPSSEKLFIRGDFNSHVGTTSGGFERVHGGFGYGDRNQEGVEILNFAIVFDLMIRAVNGSSWVGFGSGQVVFGLIFKRVGLTRLLNGWVSG